MKIFETVQNNLEPIGFSENRYSFNQRQLELGLAKLLCMTLFAVHLFYFADTPADTMNCIYELIVQTLVFVAHASTVFKTVKIFIFIRRFKELISQSKLAL